MFIIPARHIQGSRSFKHIYDETRGMVGSLVYSEMQFDDLACSCHLLVKRSFNVVSVIIGSLSVYNSLKYHLVIGSEVFRDVDTVILLVMLDDDKICEYKDGSEQDSIPKSDM